MTVKPIVFIHGSDPTSRTKARQHVSRVIRQRERENWSKQAGGRTGPPAKGASGESDSENHSEDSDNVNDYHSRGRVHPISSLRALIRKASIATLESEVDRHGDVEKVFSSIASDPFNTLVIHLSPMATELLHHYNTGMPSIEFDVNEKSAFIPCRQLALASAIDQPTAFHVIVAIGGIHRAAISGSEEPLIVAYHLGEALRLFRGDVETATAANWTSLVQPFIEFIACEELRGQYTSLSIHLNGLRVLLRRFGGLENLHGLPRIQTLLCFVLHGAGVSYFHPGLRLNASADAGIAELQIQPGLAADIRDHCELLSGFMTKVDQIIAADSPLLVMVRNYFHKSTRVARLLCLSSETEDNFIPGDGFGKKGFHRVAVLFLIAWDILDMFKKADRYTIQLYLEKLHFLYHPNLRLYKFFLMQDGTTVNFTNAAKHWDVIRMMQIYKLFDISWRTQIVQSLVDLIQRQPVDPEKADETGRQREDRWPIADLTEDALANLLDEVRSPSA